MFLVSEGNWEINVMSERVSYVVVDICLYFVYVVLSMMDKYVVIIVMYLV